MKRWLEYGGERPEMREEEREVEVGRAMKVDMESDVEVRSESQKKTGVHKTMGYCPKVLWASLDLSSMSC